MEKGKLIPHTHTEIFRKT